MVDKFELLECHDEDVISFENLLSKFCDFKNDISQMLLKKMQSFFYQDDGCNHSIIERFQKLSPTSFGDCQVSLNLSSNRNGEPCEILRLGSEKWQKGKLRLNAFIHIPIADRQQNKHGNIEFTLEFCPDESQYHHPVSESPLDDLRRIINNEENTAN
ncbi:hypothetical protein NIES4101_69570 [Calothrix sp. NIES-4101]|nr:hypothetical protein NIES4101_69570 [Calothrix sp. NIES-4101]